MKKNVLMLSDSYEEVETEGDLGGFREGDIITCCVSRGNDWSEGRVKVEGFANGMLYGKADGIVAGSCTTWILEPKTDGQEVPDYC